MADDIYSKGPKVFRTYGSPFTNTDNIFIQYDDIIRARDLNMIYLFKESEEACKIFNLDEVQTDDLNKLIDWYRDRPYKEAMCNFDVRGYENEDPETFLDWTKNFTIKEYDDIPLLDMSKLIFYKDLKYISTEDREITGNIYVYTESYSKLVDVDLKDFSEVRYVYGDFEKVIADNKITNNSTFVFSEEKFIYKLRDMNKINYASILISGNYSYNDYKFIDEFEGKPVKIFLYDSLVSAYDDDSSEDEFRFNNI